MLEENNIELDKTQVEKWCKENNHAIVDLSAIHIPKETIFNIAMQATGVHSIEKKDQKPEHSFARFLAISYLDTYFATGILAKMVGINYTTISYARNMDLLNCNADIKFFKPWQANAILYFRERVNYLKAEMKKAKKDA